MYIYRASQPLIYKTLVLSCLPTPLIALQASKPTTLPGEYARAFPVELLPAVRASPHRVQQVMSPGRCRSISSAHCVTRSARSQLAWISLAAVISVRPVLGCGAIIRCLPCTVSGRLWRTSLLPTAPQRGNLCRHRFFSASTLSAMRLTDCHPSRSPLTFDHHVERPLQRCHRRSHRPQLP